MHIKSVKGSLCSLLLLVMSTTTAMAQGKSDRIEGQGRASGVLRATGDTRVEPLLKQWQAAFSKKNPAVQFSNNLKGEASAIYGLETRASDIALMSRPLHPFERYGTFERSWIFPVEIELATGSDKVAAHSAAYAVVVHKDNPLSSLSLDQVDMIFGAQRTGGWKGLAWDESAARTLEQTLRSWNQVDQSSALGNLPINVYGPALLGAGVLTEFQMKVMHGGSTWNESYREYADTKQMLSDLAKDKQGIGYATLDEVAAADVKVIALSPAVGAEAVLPSARNLAERRYPLHRTLYLYFTRDTQSGDPGPVDPKVKEFVSFLLSPEGQAIAAKSNAYFPLSKESNAEQVSKLTNNEWPAERPRP